MKILKVDGQNKDFIFLCKALEQYQFSMIPILKEKNYSLTHDLDEVVGFVLYADNKPVGSIGLKRVSDDTCEIVRVFVCEDYRRRGYAKILFEKIEELARLMGFKNAQLVAWVKSTAALKLYRKLKYNFSEEKISEWYGGDKYVEIFKEL